MRYRIFTLVAFISNHREWCKQQMMEKMQEEANTQQAKRLYDLKAMENDQRALELARAEQECKRAINIATKDLNRALSNERAAKLNLEKQQEHDDNMTEITNNIFGDMLTENPNVAQSAFGSHRVIPDRWKGMSPAELNKIRSTQNNQIAEKKVIACFPFTPNQKFKNSHKKLILCLGILYACNIVFETVFSLRGPNNMSLVNWASPLN